MYLTCCKFAIRVVIGAVVVSSAAGAFAQDPQDCSQVPDYGKLKAALTSVVKQGTGANGGLGNQEWGAVLNRDGIVCAVVFSGKIVCFTASAP